MKNGFVEVDLAVENTRLKNIGIDSDGYMPFTFDLGAVTGFKPSGFDGGDEDETAVYLYGHISPFIIKMKYKDFKALHYQFIVTE